jgi:hypothetical protein
MLPLSDPFVVLIAALIVLAAMLPALVRSKRVRKLKPKVRVPFKDSYSKYKGVK